MRLKELITRSGGVITAIALLGSMMTMAGAAAPDGAYNCCICGKGFSYNTNVTNTQTDCVKGCSQKGLLKNGIKLR